MSKNNTNAYRESEDKILELYGINRVEHFIEVPEHGIRVRVQETGEGKPLLFIHGGPNAGSTWLQLASLLQVYKCLILDRPGCGLSDAISYKGVSRESLSRLVVNVTNQVLKYFKLDRIPVAASSFGAYWTMLYALQIPGRLERLVFEGCPALVQGSQVPSFMKNARNPVARLMMQIIPSTTSYSKKIMKEIGHGYSIDQQIISDDFINWYVDMCNHTPTLLNEMAMIGMVIDKGGFRDEFILLDEEIANLQNEVLFLWGEEDVFGDLNTANRLSSTIKSNQIIIYDNSGHLPWLDKPEEHAEQIRAFLSARNQ